MCFEGACLSNSPMGCLSVGALGDVIQIGFRHLEAPYALAGHVDFAMDGRLAAAAWAVASASVYLACLLFFEKWLEPWLRRRASAVVRSPIVWVRSGLFSRTWGLRDPGHAASDFAVGFAGNAFVVVAAFLSVALLALASHLCSAGPAMRVTLYLASTPLVAIFVCRLLYAAPTVEPTVTDA